ncbi:MAG: rod shape-determining protein MreC [Firmicutes bacterium]|nr:rod shape-determining protein MreC [Bacillota bacterium]
MKWDLKRWRWVAVVVVILTIAATIYVTSYSRREITGVEALLRDFVAPVARGLTQAAQSIENFFGNLAEVSQLAAANRQLEEEIRQLEMQLAVSAGYERQVMILRRALSFRDNHRYEILAAEVVGQEPVNWHNFALINRGMKDGVRPGMAVVAPEGVVGQVRNVTARTAEVMLMLDSRSSIGGRLVDNGELVLVTGQSSQPESPVVRSLVRDSQLQEGDQVVTSGNSRIFPGGLLLGTVVDVTADPYGDNKTGVLEPGVDFSRLDVVFVLLSTDEGDEEEIEH